MQPDRQCASVSPQYPALLQHWLGQVALPAEGPHAPPRSATGAAPGMPGVGVAVGGGAESFDEPAGLTCGPADFAGGDVEEAGGGEAAGGRAGVGAGVGAEEADAQEPKSGWQLAPQWAAVTPQKSLPLQHWLPGQEAPPAGFPQAPPGAARPAFNFAGGGDGVVVGGGAEGDEVEEADLQEPKWRWQPAPQWAAVTPQKPFLLQHWLSGHEAPPLEPQAPPGAAVPPLPDCRSSRPPAHKELKCQLNRARKPLTSYVERVKLASKSKKYSSRILDSTTIRELRHSQLG